VLGLKRELGCTLLGHVGPGPEFVKQVNAEIAPERLLDHLALALAAAGGSVLDGAENVVIDRERSTDLRHRRIIAS